jgi:allophanate hydrolase subunit 2
LRHAVPRGGAIDREGLAAANTVVGNALGAAAIERYGPMAIRAVGGMVAIADERGVVTMLDDGASAELAWDGARRVGYLAVDGGLDVPSFLGGRGTMLAIGRGGHEGRALRRGDRIAIGAPTDCGERCAFADHDGPFGVVPGPDLDRLSADAIDRLVHEAWRLDPRSDRVGTRLVGPVIAHASARAITTPMIEGAIECPPDAGPIVLGAEHPTTGGYPVVAVVIERDLARFHRTPLGRTVRFVVV